MLPSLPGQQVNEGYWNVSDIDALIVKGDFNGCMKTDRTADPPTPFEYKQDEITITSFADEMYAKVLPGTVVLEDPGKGELQIKSGGGWKDVVVWNPYGDDKVGYKTFVCVESVETETVSLAAGKAWEATMDLVPSSADSSATLSCRAVAAELQAAIANQEPPQGTAPAWMLQQLQVLEADYDSLELVYAQAQEQRKQLENRVLHRLHMEQQSQSKDIGNLRDVIAQSKRNEPAPGLQPLKEEATRLRSEAEQLRLLRADEKARGEQQIAALRQEVHGLQEQCQRALARRSILESTLEDLKCSHSNFANTSREVIELQRDKAVMDKERVRMERRITILDEKIGSLQKEAEDIRLRASVVMGVMPEQAASCGDVWQLRDTLQQKQLQVQELRRKLARAEREEEESRLALETAKVDASILERKIRQLRSRSAHAQA
eukprot:s2134_g10.t1